jgi:putative nucleotidyltransferase with HDIG domain
MKTAQAHLKSAKTLKIPSLPAVVLRLNQLIRDPNVGVLEIGEELAKDPDLSTRVLRIANGPTFGLKSPVLDPRHAASILGLERLGPIIMQAGTKNLFGRGDSKVNEELATHWKHSILVAQIARDLGRRCKNSDLMEPEALYTCGLLHDMGKAVFWDNKPNKYRRCLEEIRSSERNPLDIETEVMGANHAQIGAKIVLSWGLPRNLAQTIVFHHDSWRVAKAIPTAVLITLADRLAHSVAENDLEGMPQVATRRDLSFLGFNRTDFWGVATEAVAGWNEIAA